MSFRLTKQYRLLGTGDFGAVFEGARFKASSPQLLLLGASTDWEHARLGLVISKKHVGSAVARNRVKRLCREAFRHRAATLPCIDIVVVARPGLTALDNASFNALFEQLLNTLVTQHQRRKPPSKSVDNPRADSNNQ
jgi:ribonuclease P protein component